MSEEADCSSLLFSGICLFVLRFVMQEGLNIFFDTHRICRGIFGVLNLHTAFLLPFPYQENWWFGSGYRYIESFPAVNLRSFLRSSLTPEIQAQDKVLDFCAGNTRLEHGVLFCWELWVCRAVLSATACSRPFLLRNLFQADISLSSKQ